MASPAFQEDAFQNLRRRDQGVPGDGQRRRRRPHRGGVRTDPSSFSRARPATRAVARRAELDMSPSPPDGLVENLRRLDPQLRLRWGRHQHKWIIEVQAPERLPQRQQERPEPRGHVAPGAGLVGGVESTPCISRDGAATAVSVPLGIHRHAPEAPLARGAPRQGRAPRALGRGRAGGGDGREAQMGHGNEAGAKHFSTTSPGSRGGA